MIPQTTSVGINEGQVLPSLTYKLNFDESKLSGKVDNLESVMQAVRLILSVDRYSCPIYNGNYGNEIINLIGQSYDFVVADLPRMVNEALLQDDRITGTENYVFEKITIDSISVSFDVNTIYGTSNYALEVTA